MKREFWCSHFLLAMILSGTCPMDCRLPSFQMTDSGNDPVGGLTFESPSLPVAETGTRYRQNATPPTDAGWPQFMGPRNDGTWEREDTIDSFPDAGPLYRWRAEIGAGYSGPAIADGRVYVTDRIQDDGKGQAIENDIRRAGSVAGRERVLCLDEKTGRTIWQHEYDCPYTIAYPTGPRSTPTVDEDRVYTLGAMGRLICFSKSTGAIVWQKELTENYSTKPPPWGYASHPLVDGEKVFVAVGGEGSGVVAFDKQTGEEVWKSVTTTDIAYAPLVIYEAKDRKQLIFWHAEAVESLDPDTGRVHWSIKFPNEPNPSQTSIAMPRIAGNKLLITEFYKGALLLEIDADPPSVKELWRSYESDPRSRSTLNTLMTSPIVKEGYAYSIANDARGNGVFRCLELGSGNMKWTRTDWVAAKPLMFATAFVIENGDKYFMFNDLGELMIVRLSPDEQNGFEELDRAKILEPTGVARGRRVVWCQPACANGHLIVRNDKEIVSVDLRNNPVQ